MGSPSFSPGTDHAVGCPKCIWPVLGLQGSVLRLCGYARSADQAWSVGFWLPAGRRVFPDQPVDGLAEQVGVPGVPAILLDQVADQPAQAGMTPIGPAKVDELAESAIGQGRVEPPAGPFDSAVPERVELFGGV